MNACSYFQIPTGTTTAQFAAMYANGKTITERLDAIINALVDSDLSVTLNNAATTDLSAISAVFDAGFSVDQRLHIIESDFEVVDELIEGVVSENVFY